MNEVIILNDTQEYRKRKYDSIGYYVDIGDRRFWDYFPKIAFEDPELEKLIQEQELGQKHKLDNLFVFLQYVPPDIIRTEAVEWEIPTKRGPGKWHYFKKRDRVGIPLRTISGLITRSFKSHLVLYEADYSQEGQAFFNTQLTDTVIGFQSRKARLTQKVSSFHFANLLVLQLKCIDHVIDVKWFELKPEAKEVYEYLKRIIPRAKEFSLENDVDPIGFKFFLTDNYPELLEEYLAIEESAVGIEEDLSWGVRALGTLFKELFSLGYNAWPPLLCCRTAATQAFKKELSERGHKVPSITTMVDDPIEKLRGDRIWFAGMKRELEWQATCMAETFELV